MGELGERWIDRVRLLDDGEVSSATDDVLGFDGLVRLTVNAIRCASGPMVVHVDGGWGQGKTSFCRLLEQALREAPEEFENEGTSTAGGNDNGDLENDSVGTRRPLPVDMAWYVASDADGAPEDAILFGIARAIAAGDQDEALSTLRTWANGNGDGDGGHGVARREAFRGWISRELGWADARTYASKTKSSSVKPVSFEVGLSRLEIPWNQQALSSGKRQSSSGDKSANRKRKRPSEDLHEAEKKAGVIRCSVVKHRKRIALLFVDDLDRCTPEHSVRVLDALRLYANCPGLAFVVAADREVIDRAFRQTVEQLGAHRVRNERDAMEKYFRHRVDLPSLKDMGDGGVANAMKALQQRLFVRDDFGLLRGPGQGFGDGIATALALCCSRTLTIRRLKRILNQVAPRVAHYADAKGITEDHLARGATAETQIELSPKQQQELNSYHLVLLSFTTRAALDLMWPALLAALPQDEQSADDPLLGSDVLLALSNVGSLPTWPTALRDRLIDEAASVVLGDAAGKATVNAETKWDLCRFLSEVRRAHEKVEPLPVEDETRTELISEVPFHDDLAPLAAQEVLQRWSGRPLPHQMATFLDEAARAFIDPALNSRTATQLALRVREAAKLEATDYPEELVRLARLVTPHAQTVAFAIFRELSRHGVLSGKTDRDLRCLAEYVDWLATHRPSQWYGLASKHLAPLQHRILTHDVPLPLVLGVLRVGRQRPKSIWGKRSAELVLRLTNEVRQARTPAALQRAVRALIAAGTITVERWNELRGLVGSGASAVGPATIRLVADAFSGELDTHSEAIELYESLRGTALWMPSVVHNLAVLLSKRDPSRAYGLWCGVYAMPWRDRRLLRELEPLARRFATKEQLLQFDRLQDVPGWKSDPELRPERSMKLDE